MKKYTIKRILTSLFTLLAILLVLFILMQLMPGSPFNDEKLTPDMRAALYAKYGLDQPIYIQFVPGVMGGFPMSGESMLFMIDQAKKILGGDVQYSTVAGGRRMFRFATMMAIQGGNVRVGMEDGLYIKSNGELATSNAQQVEKIRRILEFLDYEIATPQEAREMLHLKGKDQVNF